jgi:formyl-CoA transferase
MLSDPHYAARDAIISLPNSQFGQVRMQGTFPKLSDTPSSVRRVAPRVPGEHNAEVYGERLALDGPALGDLVARGII